MTWKRARSPEQKEQRRAAILEAAAALFEEGGLDKASLNAIARAAHLSKANLYRYFESREAIFLHLVLDDYRELATAIERALAPLAGSDDEQRVAHEIVTAYTARPRLCSLASSLASVLERNVSVEMVVWFKTRLMEVLLRLGNAVQVAMPSLSIDGTRQFLFAAQFLVVGSWPSANPPPAVEEALQRPELQAACVDFDAMLEQTLVAQLRGLKGGPT